MIDNRRQDGSDVAVFMTWADGMKGRYSDHRKPGEEEFSWSAEHEEVDDGIPSPKLWEHKAKSTPHSTNIPLLPTSRAVAIAGYQREMLELVRDTPEIAYELSLRDIIEMPRREEGVEVRKEAKKMVARRMSRSESMCSKVFVLNLFLHFSFGGKTRGRSSGSSAGRNGSNVSPRLEKSGWSSSSGSSLSSSSSISSGNRKSTSCYAFLARKIKAII